MSQTAKDLHAIIFEAFGTDAFKDTRVLDIGCHRFEESLAMRDAGAKVTGLDVRNRKPPEGVSFIHSDFLDWQPAPEQKFDLLHLSRSALFMPNKDVMAKIALLDAKRIAIRTLSAHPKPNWPPEVLQPLYFTTAEDWTNYFEPRGYKTVHARSYDEYGPDMHGVDRQFHLTDYIGTR